MVLGQWLIFRHLNERRWQEGICLATARRTPWWYVVLDRRFDLLLVDLGSAALEYVIEEEGNERPSLIAAQSGEEVASFDDDDAEGWPSRSMLFRCCADADEFLKELTEWPAEEPTSPRLGLRGGAAAKKPVLPVKRVRLRRKTDPASAGLLAAAAAAAPAGPVGATPGLDALRQEAQRAAGVGELLETSHWVLATATPNLAIGTPMNPSDRAVFMDNFCLDRDESTAAGTVLLLEKVSFEDTKGYEQSMCDDWHSYMKRRGLLKKDGSPGMIALADEVGGDGVTEMRVLEVRRQSDGVRFRELRDFCATATAATFTDWPVKGPRTVKWCILFCLSQHNGGLVTSAQAFMVVAKLTYSDGHVMEYNLIARVLDTAFSYDQLHMLNLASMEMLVRRFQLIEEKYRHKLPQVEGKSPLDPEADGGLFLGLGPGASFGRSAICVCPELSEYIGEELAKEAAITKGKVKAVELREQVRKMNGNKKGSGGGAAKEE